MAELHELIEKIENPELRAQLQAAADKLTKQKKFGLVFEEHLPECTPLYDIPVRKGLKVSVRNGKANETYTVLKIENGVATCLSKNSKEAVQFTVTDLVTTAELGDPIYPCLQPLGEVCNAPDNELWHTLIEADNYHALQLLEYLYAGKVDCIYIDPPYNNGVSEWKYNNNIIDDNDSYRHSKWLAMMEKRLRLAKKLLNPKSSLLIVTIDDKEYLHLGCLLEEIFSESKMTMISSVINPAGKAKKGGVDFSRTDEYLFFLQIGDCPVLPETRDVSTTPIAWETFRRHSLANGRGKHGVGACGPNQFYPFYIDNKTHEIVEIGDPIPENVSRFSVKQIDGCSTVFPVRDNGIEMNWGAPPPYARELLQNGFLRVGAYSPDAPQQYSIQYLTKGTIKAIRSGEVILTEKSPDGTVNGYFPVGKPKVPTTNWNKPSHNATSHGTDVINRILCDSRFDYPKSIYAVRDCLNIFFADKKDALIVDFFAGSGTTLHAVNLMNAVDNGRRRCILVTNNEISKSEAEALTRRGLRPGDEEWENLGIARYVTWPRTKCSILGIDVKGTPLKGNYGVDKEEYVPDEAKGSYKKKKSPLYPELAEMKCADGFKTNAAFFKLGFLDKTSVALGRQFKEMLPTLWMKAGAIGRCPVIDEDLPDMLILPENKMAILNDENRFGEFAEQLAQHPEIEVVYLVTDYESSFVAMTQALDGKTTYQLYKDYLDNFRINAGRNNR